MTHFLRFIARFILSGVMIATCRADPPYMIDVWTPYEGLPQSRVLSIAQTPDGYLWIATQLGWIARFDGIRFTHFNPENTFALGSPETQKLFVDDRGVLWIADVDGRLISHSGGEFKNRLEAKPGYAKRVVRWLGRNGHDNLFVTASNSLLHLGQTARYENETNLPATDPNRLEQFCQDREGILWCRNHAGLLGRWVEGHFQQEIESGLPAGEKVTFLLASPTDDLWIGTTEGLWKRRDGLISRALSGTEGPVLQIARNPDGGLWLRTPAGVLLTRGDEVIHSTTLTGIDATPPLRPLEMHADSRGGVWIVKFGGGVWHVDADGALTVLTTHSGLPSDFVETWFEDREKIIWLGTAAGLVRLRPRWFQLVDTNAADSGPGVASITEDVGGAMWFGRANGVTRWQNGVAEDIALPRIRGKFPIADVTVAPGGSPGEIWLGTVQNGAMQLRDGQIEHPFPFAAPGYAIRVVRKDPQGGIWFGGEFGLFRWDGKTLHQFGEAEGLNPGHIHDISFDEQGNPWIAKGEDLLAVYQNGRFKVVPLPGVSNSLRINTVLCGIEGNIYLGTVGSGLFHLSRGKLFRYGTQDGLPGNSVTQLLEDNDGYLWGGTHQGIFRVSTTALNMRSKGVKPLMLFQSYGHSDGLPSAECSGGLQPACWKTRDGRPGTTPPKCAVEIDPDKLKKNIIAPTVLIEQMQVNDGQVRFPPGHEEPVPVTIPAGRHRYEFNFTAFNFAAPEKINFQWRLSGVDADWVDGQDERKVAYSSLDPGDYRFEVRASNNDGVWSPEPSKLDFHVDPYFWQRPIVQAAFVLLGLVAVSLLLAGIMHRKYSRELVHLEYQRTLEQQRFRHKQAMTTERSRIAAELHDDLGANLTQIQWLTEAATKGPSRVSGENELIHRVSRKTHEMVRLIDQIVWAVNPKNDTLEQLVTYVCNFAEQYFRDSPTRCRIDVAEEIPVYTLEADVRHHLFLIAKEALHNVAKHAATDRVWVRVTCHDRIFKLVIEDRGRGYDPVSVGAGYGLSNMNRRARTAGAELDIASAPEHGTRVSLILKLKPPAA